MSALPIEIVPFVGSSRPAIMRSVVVLPQPDGPRSAKNEPSGIVSDRSSTAVKSPKDLVRLFNFKSPLIEDKSATIPYQPPSGTLRRTCSAL